MRLSDFQVRQIVAIVESVFPHTKHIILFGSRLNDEISGGDIDLYIEVFDELGHAAEIRKTLIAELRLALKTTAIDVLFFSPNIEELPMHRIAKETGVCLNQTVQALDKELLESV